MAIFTPTTAPAAKEALPWPCTEFGLCFVDLLNTQHTHINVVRELSYMPDVSPDDPDWQDRFAATLFDLHDVLARITTMPARSGIEVALRRMALVIATLVRKDSSAACRWYLAHQDAFAEHLAVPGDDGHAARARQMIEAAHKRIRLMTWLTKLREDLAAQHTAREISQPDLCCAPALAA